MNSSLNDFEKNGVPVEMIEFLEQNLVSKSVAKGHILLHKGEISTKSYFVEKGCLRSYTIDEKGKEHIFMFAPENWIISDIQAQTFHLPSELYIDAIEDSEIKIFDNIIFDNLAENQTLMKANVFEKLFKRIAVLQKRIILLMSATALERYEDFLKTYPNIVQRVPQKMIASYLGITPEALSKIRGVRAKNK